MKRLLFISLSLLTLSACQTLQGAGEDLDSLMSTKDQTSLPAGPAPCPPAKIMPELKEMVEFSDLSNPSSKTEISRLKIREIKSHCTQEDGNLVVRLDISFDGALGPKARIRETDKPSYAFPYFVAVSGPKGGVLAKELFAASISYDAQQNETSQVETITQHIPLNGDGNTPDYSVLIGFQLAEEQLAYNRAEKTEGHLP